MSAEKDGGPAFPHSGDQALGPAHYGMSLRDYFAAQAVPGLVNDCGLDMGETDTPSRIAVSAYAVADAMLAERAKGIST